MICPDSERGLEPTKLLGQRDTQSRSHQSKIWNTNYNILLNLILVSSYEETNDLMPVMDWLRRLRCEIQIKSNCCFQVYSDFVLRLQNDFLTFHNGRKYWNEFFKVSNLSHKEILWQWWWYHFHEDDTCYV